MAARGRTAPARTSPATARPLALADREQRTDQRAHHAVAERVGDDRRDGKGVSAPRDQSRRISDRTVVAPSRRRQNAAKSCSPSSVAAARFMSSSRAGMAIPEHVMSAQRVDAVGRVRDAVGIAARKGAEAGVESVGGLADVPDANVPRQHTGRTACARCGAASSYTVDGQVCMCHLAVARARRHRCVLHTVRGTRDGRSTVASASSTTPWTVRWPGCIAQPAKSVPS